MESITDRTLLPQLLTRLGHRLTGPRRAILDVVSGANGPLTVAEIHERLALPEVNRVTVYRTVHLLVRANLLRLVGTTHRTARYALGEQLAGHHYLLICQQCGRVEEAQGCPVPEDAVARLTRRVRRVRKFRVIGHQFRLLGLCVTCHA